MKEWLNGMSELMPQILDMGLNLVVALLILIIGWWVSSMLGRWVRRVAQQSPRVDPTIVPMFQTTVVWSVRIFTVIAVLARFGVQTASLIAVLGAAGLAVGLALQGTLQNIAAGIMLLVLRPIRAGEYVGLSNGYEGTVEEVGLFLTRLVQADGINVSLPNSTVWTATIINYSRNVNRRCDIPVIIHYGDNLDEAVARLKAVVKAHALVLQEPAPSVRAIEYRDTGTVVNVRVWATAANYWDMRWDLFQQLRTQMSAAGFRAPVPVREIQAPPSKDGA
ncbi:mechanosensitive ion channel family protein [Bordetella avium]|uniref:Small-conductance mechanosensitive channel n=1 Tax=Bordetella avium (strain 197N) TaxID=360910 RepID=Q2KX18_BORA1|nr:mechanosensitive ion channel domain-containing protein [Bordetella avium]AZY49928.1 mechanosensitive ion channel protein MscS [Bordetella avium]AZY53295.1 mechanosensitive ion channel protein MscS [Bordetella avium]RIQ13113.1 mechanosensitive ion channel family protein [Bordetella avium]RIQ17284.1 mechanosensitive ion channel family protein [Bordetella avium]RIQ33769.1 mechanosensitive ion channel family protein [Bordetella avium]